MYQQARLGDKKNFELMREYEAAQTYVYVHTYINRHGSYVQTSTRRVNMYTRIQIYINRHGSYINRHGSYVQTYPHGAYFVCMYTGYMYIQARLVFKHVYTFVHMYINRHGSVTKKFIELMREYEATQGKYKALLKQRVARQVCCSLLQRVAVCCGKSAIVCFSVLR